MKFQSIAVLGAVATVFSLGPLPSIATSHTPPGISSTSTAPMPLGLGLAKKLVLPEPLTTVQKLIGTPGAPYVPNGFDKSSGTWYRWYHDCGNAMSFGDVIVRNEQAVSLWFQGCAGENVKRFGNGDFYVISASGKTSYLDERERRAMSQEANRYRNKVKVPCAMMSLDIEQIANEHHNFPSESRDEIVARYVEAEMQSVHAMGQKIGIAKAMKIGGQFVDYVEAHSAMSPESVKQQFVSDCLNNQLGW